LASINGYTIKGVESQTTVITPDQNIYVNNEKVTGKGPKLYTEYVASHPVAPNIQGPGWPENLTRGSTKAQQSSSDKELINTLKLTNQSTVTGDVHFDSGYGEILVEKGSEFKGKVFNGQVKRL
jgi:hypothetical protein